MAQNKNQNHLEIIIETKELAYLLSFALSVVEKRNVATELNNVKLVAKDGILEIGATDLDLYLNQNMGAQVIMEGQTTVATQILSEIVRKIPDKEIRLKQEPGSDNLQIIGNSCKFDLLTMPVGNFPIMEDFEGDITLTIACSDFARIVEYTSFAMSNEETRYNLNGIYLHVRNGEFCSAATDAHRVSVASVNVDSATENFGVIVPRKTVTELLKIIRDTKNINSDITITLGENKVKFKCNNLVLISKLIDGTFPDYENFIPTNNESKLIINTKILADAIDRVATVTMEKFRAIKFIFSDSNLVITASGEAKGSANEVLSFSQDADKYCSFTGGNLSVGFNSRYIMDVLSTLKEEQVQLYLSDLSSPVLIKTEINPNDSFVVMPVKI